MECGNQWPCWVFFPYIFLLIKSINNCGNISSLCSQFHNWTRIGLMKQKDIKITNKLHPIWNEKAFFYLLFDYGSMIYHLPFFFHDCLNYIFQVNVLFEHYAHLKKAWNFSAPWFKQYLNFNYWKQSFEVTMKTFTVCTLIYNIFAHIFYAFNYVFQRY